MNLRWTKSKRYALDSAISRGRYEFGCTVIYYQLTPRVGIKFYSSLEELKRAMERNELALKAGIAPRFGNNIITRVIDGDERYGYLVETVGVMKVTLDELDELYVKLKDLGFSALDYTETHNCGSIKGKPVIYDFDDATVEMDW